MLSKDKAREMVVELNSLPQMNSLNSASYFSDSIDWHPRWTLIFKLIENVKKEYEELYQMKEDIGQAIKNGKVTTITDWGNGWEWKANVVTVNNRRIRVFSSGAVSFYGGQYDKPVLNLNQ